MDKNPKHPLKKKKVHQKMNVAATVSRNRQLLVSIRNTHMNK